MNVDDVIATLGLAPHPEGGFYRETYRHIPEDGGRGDVTVIYFLLKAGERSAWHRIDATEVWLHHAGSPLLLDIWQEDAKIQSLTLGTDFSAGDAAQGIVPPHAWQTAQSLGDWTLVSCTVAPAFLFETFEMAPPGWAPDAPTR